MARDPNRLLEVYLSERRAPCPRCGYDLGGLTFEGRAARCPECGQPLHLAVRLGKGFGEPRERSAGLRRAERVILISAGVFVVFVLVLAGAAALLRL